MENHYGYGIRTISELTQSYNKCHLRNSKSAGAPFKTQRPMYHSRENLSSKKIAFATPRSPGKFESKNVEQDEDERMFKVNAFFKNDSSYQNVDCVLGRNKKRKVSKY